jgi:cobalt-zinc-cadmium efflux system membrane fusion protein
MKIRKDKIRWQMLAAAIAVLGVLTGCEGSGSKTTPSAKDPDSAQLFSIPQDQMSHVQVVTVHPTTLQRTLRLTGAVAYNSFRTTPVITQVSGPVSRIMVVPGQRVTKGQPMLYVASPDYSQLRSNYLKAKDSYQLAQKDSARAQDLYTHHALAEKDLLAAQSAEVQAGADVAAATAALKVIGINDPDSVITGPPSFEIPVLAPVGGEVVEQLVSVGQLVQPGATQCFTLSDTSNVWVLVNIYQKDLPYVHVGQSVTVQTDSYPDEFHGRISYVAPALDPNTRTLQARIDTHNPGRKLKRDMYVVATVDAGTVPNAIAVPDAAVLRDSENLPFVYAEFSPNHYGKRAVTVGESVKGQTEINSGLKPGDRVISDGSLFLQFANSLQR